MGMQNLVATAAILAQVPFYRERAIAATKFVLPKVYVPTFFTEKELDDLIRRGYVLPAFPQEHMILCFTNPDLFRARSVCPRCIVIDVLSREVIDLLDREGKSIVQDHDIFRV